jgi:hypothetical protein
VTIRRLKIGSALLLVVLASAAAVGRLDAQPRTAAPDGTAEWLYLGARPLQRVDLGLPQSTTLTQGVYSSPHPFERVWKYYWHRVTPPGTDSVPFETARVHLGEQTRVDDRGDSHRHVWGFSQSPRSGANAGSFLWRDGKRSVTIQVVQQEKGTRIFLLNEEQPL